MALATKLRSLNTAFVCNAQRITSSCWNYDQSRFASSTLKPKKPANIFNMYRAEVTDQIMDKNPGLSIQELTKMISEQYRSLSKQKLETLSKEYTKQLKKFHRELLEWEESHPEMGKTKNLKAVEKMLGKPAKPGNQTNKFISNYILRNENSGFKEAYNAWNDLPSAEKEALKKEFEQDYKAYKIKLDKWEKSLSESDRKVLEDARSFQKKTASANVGKMLGKPLKPANQVAKFVSDYISKHPNCGFKEAGEAWNNLAPAKKEILKKEYEEEFKMYKIELSKWEENLTESDRDLLGKLKQLPKVNRDKDKVESSDMTKPKRPPNALNLFVKEYMSENNCLLGEAVKEWKSLGKEKKEIYENEGKALMEVYEEELVRWEKEMMKAERTDLIRKSTLKSLKS